MLPSATVTIVVSRKVRNSTASTVVSAMARGTDLVPTTVCCTRLLRTRLCRTRLLGAGYLGVSVAVGVLHSAGGLPSSVSRLQKVYSDTFHVPPSLIA